jgi:dolichol-phosphate mannosyltransferase
MSADVEQFAAVTDPAKIAQMRIAAVIPAYNEAKHLPEVIATVPEMVWRIYIVDDASTDDTPEVLAALNDDRVRHVRHETNKGVGGAMVTGYRAALADGARIIVKLDADGQMAPEDLPYLVLPIRLGLAEYVKGNRFRVARQRDKMPPHRTFGNVALSFANKVATGYWHVFDPQCGYTAIAAPALEQIDLDRISTDYFFENDMLVWLNTMGARVVDVPVTTVYGEEVSHIRLGRILTTFPFRLIGRWFWRVSRRHFVWDFSAVGMLIVAGTLATAFGFLWGAYRWTLSVTTGRVATTGTVMIAVVPLFLGFQMLLQALLLEVQSSPGADETREFQRILSSTGDLDPAVRTLEAL